MFINYTAISGKNRHAIESLLPLVFIVLQIFITLYVSRSIHFLKYTQQSLFLFDIIGKVFVLPSWFFYICGSISTLLIWQIGKKFFSGKFAIIPTVIFSTALWPIYYIVAQANSVVSLTILLGLALTYINWADSNGSIVWLAILIEALCISTLLAAPTIWMIFIILLITKLINQQNTRKLFITLSLCSIPIIIIFFIKPVGTLNHVRQQIQIYSNPGLVNSVNTFRGESQQSKLRIFSKIIENKYIYLSEFTLLKTLKQFTPSTYFTPQEKLLNFSFSPPFYVGFIFPFLFGLYLLIQNKTNLKILISTTPLVLPSVLGTSLVDLQKLIFLMPVLVFVISYGVIELYKIRANLMAKFVLMLSLILILVQFTVTLFDISNREYPRYLRYFGPNQSSIGKQ